MYNKAFHSEDISGKSFLITGGAGFIGSNIVKYLIRYKAGRVVVLDNLATGFEENIAEYKSLSNFEFIQGNICDIEDCKKACKNIDIVFHQAALGSVPRSIDNPIATNDVNVSGFLNILVAARDANVKRVVYASSSSVYGDSKEMPKKEERIGKPLSPYAVSKLTNELYANIFTSTYNMEIVGLRYFNVFGPHQNPKGEYAAAIPLFMQALIHNKAPMINGDGEQTRDFTFVENAVEANIKAAFTTNKEAIGNVFNVAVNERVSINKLVSVLKKLTNATVNPIHREERKGDVRDSLADIAKAQKILNYSPAVKVEEGLAITLEWFKHRF